MPFTPPALALLSTLRAATRLALHTALRLESLTSASTQTAPLHTRESTLASLHRLRPSPSAHANSPPPHEALPATMRSKFKHSKAEYKAFVAAIQTRKDFWTHHTGFKQALVEWQTTQGVASLATLKRVPSAPAQPPPHRRTCPELDSVWELAMPTAVRGPTVRSPS